jgi:hypothetical protein
MQFTRTKPNLYTNRIIVVWFVHALLNREHRNTNNPQKQVATQHNSNVERLQQVRRSLTKIIGQSDKSLPTVTKDV